MLLGRSLDMEGCEYNEWVVADSREGVVLQLGVWRGADVSSPYKIQLLTKCYRGPRNWWNLVNTVMKLRVPLNSGDLLTSWVTISFSRSTCSMELVLLPERQKTFGINATKSSLYVLALIRPPCVFFNRNNAEEPNVSRASSRNLEYKC